jgi:hypothetical protein
VAAIAAAPPPERSNHVSHLMVACSLRGIIPRAMSEVTRMGIEFDLTEVDIVRELMERVERETAERVEGTARNTLIDAVVTVMRSRFGTKPPAGLQARLQGHSLEQLHEILARSGTAVSADDALDISPGLAPR